MITKVAIALGFTLEWLNILRLKLRSHTAKRKRESDIAFIGISIVLFSDSESKSDITNEWVHGPFQQLAILRSLYVN